MSSLSNLMFILVHKCSFESSDVHFSSLISNLRSFESTDLHFNPMISTSRFLSRFVLGDRADGHRPACPSARLAADDGVRRVSDRGAHRPSVYAHQPVGGAGRGVQPAADRALQYEAPVGAGRARGDRRFVLLVQPETSR